MARQPEGAVASQKVGAFGRISEINLKLVGRVPNNNSSHCGAFVYCLYLLAWARHRCRPSKHCQRLVGMRICIAKLKLAYNCNSNSDKWLPSTIGRSWNC